MSSASFFEQLTSSVSISIVSIISVVTLAVIILFTVASRVFFSSSTKPSSSSKQPSNKDKKTKEVNTKKQQQQQADTTAANKKKNNNKTKKNAAATPPPAPVKTAASSSSTSSSSEESENEKVDLITPTKKTSSSKQQQQPQASGRNENIDVIQSGDGKKKQTKAVETPTPNKQQTTKKGDATNKVNATTSNKKQPVVVNSEVVKRTPVDDAVDSDHEDEGQWLTQSNKQVSNRNRNKPKTETLKQESPPASTSSNRKTTTEKRTTPTNNPSSLINKNESDVETTVTSNTPVQPPPTQEPIEICQLLPTSENRYTANDDWWKQALNKQQTFSIDDIGEWPEREQDEQYIVQVKRIIPIKTALSEKDINVDENDSINNYKHGKNDEKLNFNEQVNSSSVVTGESTTTSQSKKKATNVRRLS
ncbi:unnamed protein product [Rotaria sp. Silwood1]|nr:unnamed protein product [Rotaria sp. Silwood1]CAF4706307.1 unnamed protein product [Rotaria sp. Silwood1]